MPFSCFVSLVSRSIAVAAVPGQGIHAADMQTPRACTRGVFLTVDPAEHDPEKWKPVFETIMLQLKRYDRRRTASSYVPEPIPVSAKMPWSAIHLKVSS